MNRRTVYTIAIVVILFFLFFNPFKRKSRTDIPKPYTSSTVLAELTEYVEASGKSPERYLADLFRRHDIVFLGEFGLIKQQVEAVQRAIPLLYESGVRNLGIEFALFEDQSRIDEVLLSAEYNAASVHEILFNRMVIWGYEEYAGLFEAAWRLNASLDDGDKPFRIVGLNLLLDWNLLVEERDMRKPEVVAQLYANGIPDVFIAETIMDEFVRKGEKALIYTSMEHAFTGFESADYVENAKKMNLADSRRAGNIVYDNIGNRAATVLFHSPWPDRRAQTLISFPLDAAVDRLLEELPEESRFFGVDVIGTPFGALDADRNDFARGQDDVTLADMCSGYIATGLFKEWTPTAPIPGFINDANFEAAVRDFPGPNIESTTVEEMNSYISGVADSRAKLVERF